jgi:hypothetical protein
MHSRYCLLLHINFVLFQKTFMNLRIIILSTLWLTIAMKAKSQNNQYRVICVGFYNLENLFDTIDDPKTNDSDFTPDGSLAWTDEKYQMKLNSLSIVLDTMAKEHCPDGTAILGVAEVENRKVLEDLVMHERIAKKRYQVIHFDSPDRRGIDVGLLYNPRYFREINSRSIPVELYNLDGKKLISRDILYVKGVLDGDTTHIMVNHWPSRRGGESATRPLREGYAAANKSLADSILQTDENARILIMGDLNDNPDNTSMTKILKARKKIKDVQNDEFFNPFYDSYSKGIGTLAYQDSWSLFDQIVLSFAYTQKKNREHYTYAGYGIVNKPFMQQKTGRFKGYPLRTFDGETFINGYSDHFPVYIIIIKAL